MSKYMTLQPPEVFCKKRCFQKFCKIHRKTSVPESVFLIKLQASLQSCRTPFLQTTSGRLLLTLVSSQNYLSSFTQTVRKPWVKRDNKINFLLGGRVYTHSSHQGMHCIWNQVALRKTLVKFADANYFTVIRSHDSEKHKFYPGLLSFNLAYKLIKYCN